MIAELNNRLDSQAKATPLPSSNVSAHEAPDEYPNTSPRTTLEDDLFLESQLLSNPFSISGPGLDNPYFTTGDKSASLGFDGSSMDLSLTSVRCDAL